MDDQNTSETEEQDFSFSAFANAPFYVKINEDLVSLSGVCPGQSVVDLACGVGGVTKLIFEKLRGAKDSMITGVDLSSSALKQAREDFKDVKDAMVEFVQGRAEHLSQLIKEKVDAVVFCNAIHQFDDKETLLNEISNTLKPGGIFAFNTSFYEGGHTEGTEQWYRKWMFRSIRILRSEFGLTPVRANKVESRRHISVDQYIDILRDKGFDIREKRVTTIDVPLEGWVLISQFEDWINGVMPGVPLAPARESLQKAATQLFEEMKVNFISRDWLDIVAVKQ
ncbi:MAG: methyltransferase domain-containing protein [SAR202 cluster bacterium]|nr:methyltransferase domain-containing protein [SAR202 cluster bacterium]